MGRRIQKGKNMEAQKDNAALIVLDGGEVQTFPLGQSVTYIGYDAGGGIAPGPHCAGACAKLTWLNDHHYLFDADAPSGVLLNGAPLRSGALLRERDVISLRGHRLLFLGDRLLYARPERG